MKLNNKRIMGLKKGCGYKWGMLHSDGYDGRTNCGDEYPKGWLKDKRLKIKKYPVQLCWKCKLEINKELKRLEIKKLKEFYSLNHGKQPLEEKA